ncbi:Uma2 family endonuclease [Actinoallomurus rhizosphaericola]|uniref:Uma2 family endonuclease n=1 Tax=Actinoallomurus rhizosphaericola TaxID=2952536 RepID=UPI0020913F84|nr:Uma2 family endonuclease [Actinoallomurus rhizosphaericola]MCO5993242.1 Uma2 family endonuclease [Actinoallomurus rhizosphaericola]
MAVQALEVPVARNDDIQSVFREMCGALPRHRVELVNGRIVVNPVPTGEHNRIVYQLLLQLLAVVQGQGWQIWNDITLFLGPQRDRYRPDLTVVPAEPKMWAKDHVHGDQVLLVVEVVSASSVTDDHDVKPRQYAAGGVPLCLVVDVFTRKVRLLSQPGPDGYEQETDVALGRPLDLPEPWKLTIDTAALAE